jgi:hypothetical protein
MRTEELTFAHPCGWIRLAVAGSAEALCNPPARSGQPRTGPCRRSAPTGILVTAGVDPDGISRQGRGTGKCRGRQDLESGFQYVRRAAVIARTCTWVCHRSSAGIPGIRSGCHATILQAGTLAARIDPPPALCITAESRSRMATRSCSTALHRPAEIAC